MKRYKVKKAFRVFPGTRFRCSKSKARAAGCLIEEVEKGIFEVSSPIYFFPGDVLEIEAPAPLLAVCLRPTEEELKAPCSEPAKARKAEEKPDEDADEVASIIDAIKRLDQKDDSHWTKEGLPKTFAIGEIIGREVTARERDGAIEVGIENGEELFRLE